MTQADLASFHHHGGRLDEAAAAYPDAPRPWLDLSTGINPRPWRPRIPIEVDPGPLPSIAALAKLEETAACYFGTDKARVAAVPGSEVALRLLSALDLPRPIVAVQPGYGTHADVADDRIAADALDSMAARPATLLLANPNNPDGGLFAGDALRRLLKRQHGASGWLVVDEAFADPAPGESLAAEVRDALPIVVLRSFGKFFGLAGLRLGFVIAPPAIVQRLRARLGDWPVSTQAIAWGTAAYADERWIADTRARLKFAAAGLDAILARHGYTATGSSPLFRLIEHEEAPAVFHRLAHAGILTRPFANRPDWLRVGLPADDGALDRLDRALARG